jgi:hypothetical protein
MNKNNQPAPANTEQQPNIDNLVSMERELLQQIIINFCHYKDFMGVLKIFIQDDLTKYVIDAYILVGITNYIKKLDDLNNQPITNPAPGRAFKPKNN